MKQNEIKNTPIKNEEGFENKTADDKSIEKFFSLLFEIDKRNNPHLYKN